MSDHTLAPEKEGRTTTSMAPKDDIPSSNRASWLSQFVTSHFWPTASLLQTFASKGAKASDSLGTTYPPDLLISFTTSSIPGTLRSPKTSLALSLSGEPNERLTDVKRAHLKWANTNAASFPIPDAAPVDDARSVISGRCQHVNAPADLTSDKNDLPL